MKILLRFMFVYVKILLQLISVYKKKVLQFIFVNVKYCYSLYLLESNIAIIYVC